MSMNSGNKICTGNIIDDFVSTVVNVINSGCYDINSIPVSPYTGTRAVPQQYLDSIHSIPTPNMGTAGYEIYARQPGSASYNKNITYGAIYNAIVYVTRSLLKIGSFCFYEYQLATGRPDNLTKLNEYTFQGKCIFNDNTVFSQFGINGMYQAPLNPDNPSDGGVVLGGTITVQSLNALFANCITAWDNAAKIRCDTVHEYCHSNCHTNCHDDCHSDCYDHTNTSGPGTGIPAGDGCYKNGPWVYGSLADQGYRCHSDGSDCHTDSSGSCFDCHTDYTKIYTNYDDQCHANINE